MNRYFNSWSVIVLIVFIVCFELRGCLMSPVDMGECCFGKNRLVHRRFSVDFGPTFFNQLNGWSLLFELDLKSRRHFIKWRRQTILTLRRTLRRTLWRTEDVHGGFWWNICPRSGLNWPHSAGHNFIVVKVSVEVASLIIWIITRDVYSFSLCGLFFVQSSVLYYENLKKRLKHFLCLQTSLLPNVDIRRKPKTT